MRAFNLTRQREIAREVAVADTFFSRMKGLLGESSLPREGGLWIRPCNSIHTIGMRFSIDVLYLDRKNRVVAMKRKLAPNRFSRPYVQAATVLEVTAGMIDETATGIGDTIVLG